jgi:hypothetical protein
VHQRTLLYLINKKSLCKPTTFLRSFLLQGCCQLFGDKFPIQQQLCLVLRLCCGFLNCSFYFYFNNEQDCLSEHGIVGNTELSETRIDVSEGQNKIAKVSIIVVVGHQGTVFIDDIPKMCQRGSTSTGVIRTKTNLAAGNKSR